ncbi:4-hydroxy-tetrahydrodipicolinate synthase [Bradyrhizobium sp. Ec3.3]|uniref:4-hydroxy-tetrahydrodipicolinate synthase n=1 Tax=Bradyrhizobium sp. Ec3.3 TaxID=189753 RepID=UPI0004898C24|nr:4-hydroxy-tetrahydrodipicolinate synthase [Bradyrhizobium sp. Ec3.3]
MLVPRSAWLTGYIPDLPTPFNAAGLVDIEAVAVQCERQIAAGAPALVVCEDAGEASTLSPAEQALIIRTAVDVARGRTRIIAGAGSNATSRAIELTRRAEAAGADAVLSVVPYYNKPMQEGIRAHFRAVASSTGLPIILHDVPSRTLRPLADETIVRLAESRQFAGLRDGSGDIARLMRLSCALPPGFRLLSGDDPTAFSFVASGGHGAISQLSNIAPDLCRTIFSTCRQGRLQAANYLQTRLVSLEFCLSRERPAALKYALSLLGLMEPYTRLPIVELDEPAKAELARALTVIADEDQIETAEA